MKNLFVRAEWLRVMAAAVAFIFVAGCDDDNSTNNTSGEGAVILVMHDAPVDDFKEVWLTVESVTMIGDADSNHSEVLLSEGVRMDFLDLDSISQVLAIVNVQSGTYSKIRLQVSDPEFVRDDDSVFTEPEVMLVANGHVDLNPQGTITIDADSLHIISLDLDLETSLQINQTGNGRYILRPQIFIDGDDDIDDDGDGDEGVTIGHATIVSINLVSGVLVVSLPGTEENLTITTNGQTDIETENGLPLTLAQLTVGTDIKVKGELDLLTGDIVASEIELKD